MVPEGPQPRILNSIAVPAPGPKLHSRFFCVDRGAPPPDNILTSVVGAAGGPDPAFSLRQGGSAADPMRHSHFFRRVRGEVLASILTSIVVAAAWPAQAFYRSDWHSRFICDAGGVPDPMPFLLGERLRRTRSGEFFLARQSPNIRPLVAP